MIYWIGKKNKNEFLFCFCCTFELLPGVTVNIHSPKKALPSTYLLANKYSPVFFSQDKKTPGSVYLPVNKYCLGKYLLPFSYSVSIIGHNSIALQQSQICAKLNPNFLRNELVNKSRTSKFRKSFNPIKFFLTNKYSFGTYILPKLSCKQKGIRIFVMLKHLECLLQTSYVSIALPYN